MESRETVPGVEQRAEGSRPAARSMREAAATAATSRAHGAASDAPALARAPAPAAAPAAYVQPLPANVAALFASKISKVDLAKMAVLGSEGHGAGYLVCMKVRRVRKLCTLTGIAWPASGVTGRSVIVDDVSVSLPQLLQWVQERCVHFGKLGSFGNVRTMYDRAQSVGAALAGTALVETERSDYAMVDWVLREPYRPLRELTKTGVKPAGRAAALLSAATISRLFAQYCSS